MPAIQLDPNQVKALEELGEVIAALMKEQQLDGFRDGENVIQRLASGEVTVAEFEEHSVKLAKDLQKASKRARRVRKRGR